MSRNRLRVLLAAIASTVALSTVPSGAATPQMTCSEPLEAVCVAIGTACRALDTVEAKLSAKDLINCQLG